MRILLVEDDKDLGSATAEGLSHNFAVDWVTSAEDAEDAMAGISYDLLVLDINLSGKKSGLDLLNVMRRTGNNAPVLFLTARDAVKYRIEGLNLGADDYMVKPFDLDELIARCAAIIRRQAGRASPIITIGDIDFEPATGKLLKAGKIVQLSALERGIFEVLVNNRGGPVAKERIAEKIYDWSREDFESNTIEVHIASLRKKLGRELITTIRGVGYAIVQP